MTFKLPFILIVCLAFILESISTTLLAEVESDADSPFRETIRLDLSMVNFENQVHEIKSPWNYYAGQLLTPESLHEGKSPEPVAFYSFSPENMNSDEIRHGTFHLRLILPEEAHYYSIFIPEIRCAAKVWIDNKLVFEKGVIGRSLAEERPEMRPFLTDLKGTSTEVDIVVQVSSYSYVELGPPNPIYIGYPNMVYETQQAPKIRDAFAVGAIAIMAFYHFSLFFLRRDRVAPLWFGLFCLLVAIRTLVRSEGFLIYHIIEHPNFEWLFRLEYWGFNVGAATCLYFIYILYSRDLSRLVFQIGISGSLLYALFVAVLPARIYGELLIPFQFFVLSCAVGVLYGLIKAILNRRNGSVLFIFGFLALLTGVVVDILKHHGVIQFPTIVHLGLFCFILFQAIILSKRFARAFSRVEEAEVEIRQLNDSLEKKVQERTQTIRIILDNVKAGFLLVDQNLKINEGFTRSCPSILGKEIEAGQSFIDLFDLSQRQRDHFELAINQVFDDVMPESATLSQIQGRVPVGDRVISLQGSIVREDSGRVQSILFTITDSTLLVHAEKEAKLNQVLLRIMQNKEGFRSFILDTYADLDKATEACHNKRQDQVRMILHTLKGNFAAYGLEEISQFIHEMEDKSSIASQNIAAIKNKLQQFLEDQSDIIAIEDAAQLEKSYVVKEESFHRLLAQLKSDKFTADIQNVFEIWVKEVKQLPIRQLMGPMVSNIYRIADRLGKSVEVKISGGDLLIDPDRYRSLFQNLLHLLRNSLDHGIEFPEDRQDKNPRGRIDVIFQRQQDSLQIIVADDGQGIDIEKIRSIASSRNLFAESELETMSSDELVNLIFQPGFSTADNINDLSGRGIGMSALKTAVQQLAGQITVQFQQGKGCRFEIIIPEYLSHIQASKIA